MNENFYLALLEKEREDKRKELEMRPLKIKKGVIKNAEGSALVELGKTKVIAGVKCSIGEPFPDNPDQGIIVVDFDLSPVSHKETPSELIPIEAEFARVIDRGIREGKVVDLRNLVIKKGELVWTLNIDIVVLNDDGNVIDAGAIASLVALSDTVLPKYEDKKERKLKINNLVLPFTFVKIKEKIFYDPNKIEEDLSNVRFTILRSKNEIHGIQKSKDGFLEENEISYLLEASKKLFNKLSNRIAKYIE